MSARRGSQQWDRTALHPALPGRRLTVEALADGDEVRLYDEENPEAFIVGEAVEVGTRR